MSLSILMPTYNCVCVQLVRSLLRQAEGLGVPFEIVVGDDGSTDRDVIAENRLIGGMPRCRFVRFEQNRGRAAIRNSLVRTARFEWVLLMDCDMLLPHGRFLATYLESLLADVVDGGIRVDGDKDVLGGNIRFLYESALAHEHTVERRRGHPYRCFSTANFLVRREVALAHPFDERFVRYGYEDVLFGRELERAGVSIAHIDNPVVFAVYEPNDVFIGKTEEGLRTLYEFRDDLRGYSHLLSVLQKYRYVLPASLLERVYRLLGPAIRRNLTGSHPWLYLFNIYKILYYNSLITKSKKQ